MSSPILIQSAGSSMQVTVRRMYGSEHFLTRSMAIADDLDIRIGWPNNALLLFDMDKGGSRHVCNCLLPILSTPFILSVQILLQSDDSGSYGSLWRLVKLGPIASDSSHQSGVRNPTPQELIIDPPASTTMADTIIDAEGLKLGGNGELAVTTTTTTVTTTVTKVKRVAV